MCMCSCLLELNDFISMSVHALSWRDLTVLTALQICHEFERFSAYLPAVKVGNFFGGLPLASQKAMLKDNTPHIVVGTPGRLKQVGMTHLYLTCSCQALHFITAFTSF